MDEQSKDPLQLVKELVLLIVEARTPDFSVKGRVEGPHCPVIRGRPAHKCNAEKVECIRASEFCHLAQRLWMNSVPICMDILLLPACPHGQEEVKVTEGTMSSLINENALLLERWNIEGRKRRQEDGLSSNMLLQAVRSYLHFSQISSWLYSSAGALPGLLAYRIYAPGEEISLDFPHNPDMHRFPMCLATYHHIMVTVNYLPRQASIPVLLCAQDETNEQNTTSKTKRNISDSGKGRMAPRERPEMNYYTGKLLASKKEGVVAVGSFASGKGRVKAGVCDGQRSQHQKMLKTSYSAVKSLQDTAISSLQKTDGLQYQMPEPDPVPFGVGTFGPSNAGFVGKRRAKQTLTAEAIATKKAENLARLNLGDGGDRAQMGGDVCCDVRTFASKVYTEEEVDNSCELYRLYRDTRKPNAAYHRDWWMCPIESKGRGDASFRNPDVNSSQCESGRWGKSRQPFIGGLGIEQWGEIGPWEEGTGGVKVKKKDGEKDRRIEQRKPVPSFEFHTEEYDMGWTRGMYRQRKENQDEQVREKGDGVPMSIRRKKEQELSKVRGNLDFQRAEGGSNRDPMQYQFGQKDKGLYLSPADNKNLSDSAVRDKRSRIMTGENQGKILGKKRSSLSLREASEEEFIRKLSDRLSVASVSEDAGGLQTNRKKQQSSSVYSPKSSDDNWLYNVDQQKKLSLGGRENQCSGINSATGYRSSEKKEPFTDDADRETESFFKGFRKTSGQAGKKGLCYDANISQLTIDVSSSPDIFEDSDDTPVASPNQTPRHKSMGESLVKSVAEKTIWQHWQAYQENLSKSSDMSESQNSGNVVRDSERHVDPECIENGTETNSSVVKSSPTSDEHLENISTQSQPSNSNPENNDMSNSHQNSGQAICNIEDIDTSRCTTSQEIPAPIYPHRQSNNFHPSIRSQTNAVNAIALASENTSRESLNQNQTVSNQLFYNSPNSQGADNSLMEMLISSRDAHSLEKQISVPQSSRKIFEENRLPLVSYDAGSDSFKKVEQSYGSQVLHSPKVLFSYDLPSQQMSEPKKCIDFGEALESEFFRSKIGEAVGLEAIGKYMSQLATLSVSANADNLSQDVTSSGKNVRSKFEQGYLSEIERNERMSFQISQDVSRNISEVSGDSDKVSQSEIDLDKRVNGQDFKNFIAESLIFDGDFGEENMNSNDNNDVYQDGQRMDQTSAGIENKAAETTEDGSHQSYEEDLLDGLNGDMESPTLTAEEAKTLGEEFKRTGVRARRQLLYEDQSKDKEANQPASKNHFELSRLGQTSHNNFMHPNSASITNEETSAIPATKTPISMLEPLALSQLSPPLSSSLSSSSSLTSSVRESVSIDSHSSLVRVISDQPLIEEKEENMTSAHTTESLKIHNPSPLTDSTSLKPKAAPSPQTIDFTTNQLPSSSLPTFNAKSQDLLVTNNPTCLSKATLSQPSPSIGLDFSPGSDIDLQPQVSSDLQALDSKSTQNGSVFKSKVIHAPNSLEIISTTAGSLQLASADTAIYANSNSDILICSSTGSKPSTSTKLPPNRESNSLSSGHEQNFKQTNRPEDQAIHDLTSCPSSLSKICDRKIASDLSVDIFTKSNSSSNDFFTEGNYYSNDNSLGSDKVGSMKSKLDKEAMKNENVSEKGNKRGGKKKNSLDKEKRNIQYAQNSLQSPLQSYTISNSIEPQNASSSELQLKPHAEINGNTAACKKADGASQSSQENKNFKTNKSTRPEFHEATAVKTREDQNRNSDNKLTLQTDGQNLPDFEPTCSGETMQNGTLHHGFSSAKIIQGTLDTKSGFEVDAVEEVRNGKFENDDDPDSDVVFYLAEQQSDNVSTSSPSLLSSALQQEKVTSLAPTSFRSSSLSADVDLEMRSRADLGLNSKVNETRSEGSRDANSLPGSPPLHGDPPGWNSVPPHRTVSTPSCMDREVKAPSQRSSSKPSVIQQQNCDTACQIGLRKMAVRSASMIFNSRTGLPTQSSPAPLKRKSGGTFDYDASLLNTRAIKNAFSCSKLASNQSDKSQNNEEEKKRTLSTSAPASTNCLLGNFEESILNGRIDPVGTVDGFNAEIGASGSFCPKHLHLPVSAFFFALSDDNAPSPYLGHINLESVSKKGYHIPKRGTVQVTLFNPSKTVVKMFVVMYDLSDMPPSSQTFIRQRTVYCPTDPNSTAPSYLRYLIHLRCASSRSGKIYLHTDIRLIFARHKLDIDAKTVQYELKSYTEGPRNPKYSPKK